MKLRLITIAAVTLTGIGLTDNWFVALMAMYLFTSLALTVLLRPRKTPDRPSSAVPAACHAPAGGSADHPELSGSVGPSSLPFVLPADRSGR